MQVTIGTITTGPTAVNDGAFISGSRTFYRNPVQVVGAQKTASGKGVDLAAPGNINGQAVIDVSLDTLEDKPWRKPGTKTWLTFCSRRPNRRFPLGRFQGSDRVMPVAPPMTAIAAPWHGATS